MDFLTSHKMHGSPHPTYSCVAIWRVLKLKEILGEASMRKLSPELGLYKGFVFQNYVCGDTC